MSAGVLEDAVWMIYLLANGRKVYGLAVVVHGVLTSHSFDGGVCFRVTRSGRTQMLVTLWELGINACAVGSVLD